METMTDTSTALSNPQVSVIIPARNEEGNIATCLESLVTQTGVDFEIIVVNDLSTDRTAEIAGSFPKIHVIDAGPLPEGWTGKNNAVSAGARAARGGWLLFTDADTVHLPGSLSRALEEAKENHADLLSYSPQQIAVTFSEMAILPVVFAELARQYPPSKVSDVNSPEAAANGQYLLIRRDIYESVGGHAAVASNILEDVALARAVKSSGHRIRFRYAADVVRTRMYRNFAQLREGWTKNLALLFPNPGWLAVKTLCWWAFPGLILLSPLAASILLQNVENVPSLVGLGHWIRPLTHALHHWWWLTIFVLAGARNQARLRSANFDFTMELFGALVGMPMFAYLLLRSKRAHAKGNVSWKGRTYQSENRPLGKEADRSSVPTHKTLMKTPLILILPTFFLISLPSHASSPAHPLPRGLSAVQLSEAGSSFTKTIIDPGLAVGPLKLGDSRDRALELFPKKAEDQEWNDPCGSTIDWVDASNPNGRGDLFIRLKKGRVFQIESSTTRFHTAEDITIFDSPEKVAASYREMHAWVLLTPPVPALGDRPLVFWIDRKRGIAFAFAYDPSHRKRYVYKVIVFEPGKDLCPELEKTSSPKWQSIRPYATEPPIELSPEPQ
jgi:glycosyltransferase involved in cell wall biosynthesis